MQMTEFEIYKSYKSARNQKEQVKILSELNLCDKHQIMDIIKKYEVKEAVNQEMSHETSIKADKMLTFVYKIITEELDKLEDQMQSLKKQMQECEEKYTCIYKYLINVPHEEISQD